MSEPWTLFTYRWATNSAAIRVEVYDHRGACVFATVTLGWHAAIMNAYKAAGDHPLTTHIGSRHQFNAWHDRMTKAFVIQAAKRHGFVARWSTEWSEWRITPRHLIVGETREGATYHTTDNQDAYDTIKAMSRARREARLVVTPGWGPPLSMDQLGEARDAYMREQDQEEALFFRTHDDDPRGDSSL